ncbi:alpha/beta hydrolase [Chromobacterium sp. IIBBL 290-4]|uniref:alpha/beta hydrolase n=1 Tax=Chromobacterium sp. IIBBL 290-4 TaxID=2953890 RepID=UPI0020B7E39B|nr:alpha/beta hydrolase fold domain-containing protein [Chromobacterium sp. IIBBL 290-4]UTH72985.1 alpha/beta hydrolase fold domain-containing protein [Chromobacterium sp. IIBBL 290-4]
MSQPADPQMTAFLARARAAGALDISAETLEQARAAAEGLRRWQAPPEAVDEVKMLTLPAADGFALPARLYRPAGSGDAVLPLAVFAHGGGWTRGTLDLYDAPARALANAGRCLLLAPDYRLAPEHRFPTPLLDVAAAFKWAAAHAAALGADETRLTLAGDSAGGNLAAAACLWLRDHGGPMPGHQLLIYPATDCRFDTESYQHFGDGYLLTRDAMRSCWDMYLPDAAATASPYASPLRADLADLPPASIIAAGLDPLRDDGLDYANALRAAGVAVESTLLPGLPHASLHLDGVAPSARAVIDHAGRVLRQALLNHGQQS